MPEKGPNLAGKDIEDLNLAGARLRNVFMPEVRITGAFMRNASIDGDFEGLKINGVLVEPLIEAELERLHPTLAQLRATTADGMRAGFETVYGIWDDLVATASPLGARVHERVDDEWSFAQTMRHLIYATDAWFRHAVLDEAHPYHAIALSHTEATGYDPGIDLDASPEFDEILAVRRESQLALREFVASLADADLERVCQPKASPGHPQGPVRLRDALRVILNEEYWHSTYAKRDLDTLTAAAPSA